MYQKRKPLENAIILMIDILCLLIGVGVAFGIRFHLFSEAWSMGIRYGR